MSCCQIEMVGILFQKNSHFLSPRNMVTMISKNYLVLSILFVNIKFIQRFVLILAGSTDRRARGPPTHDTIVCPMCGTIFFERDVFKLHVSNCSPKKMTTGLHGDLFSSNADDEISYIGSKKVLKGMEKTFIK